MTPRRLCSYCALICVALFGVSSVMADAPPVLSQVPDQCVAVVVVPNLSALSAKVAMINESLKLDNPQMANLLGAAKTVTGVKGGLNESGCAALAVLDVNFVEGTNEPPILLMLPVSDYQAFVGGFADAAPVEGVEGLTTITFPVVEGETTYVKQSGSYAVLSPHQHVVAAYAPPTNPDVQTMAGATGRNIIGDADALLYLNMQKLAPIAQVGLWAQRSKMRQQQRELAEMGPQFDMAAQFEMADAMMEAASVLLRDSQAAVVGLNISKEGAGVTGAMQFRPDTPMAQAFAKSPSQAVSFTHLPTKPYFFLAAADMSTLPVSEWLKAFGGKMKADSGFATIMTEAAKMYELQGDRSEFAWYAPAAPGANPMDFGGLLTFAAVYETDNPTAFLDAYGNYVEATQKAFDEEFKKLGDAQPDAPMMKPQMSYQRNLMQMDGRRVDKLGWAFDVDPEAMQMMGPMAMLFGQGFNGYLSTTDKAAVLCMGDDMNLLKTTLATAKDASGKLDADPGIAAVRKHMLANRVFEMYLNVGEVAKLVAGFAMMFGGDAGFNVPDKLPPIAMSMTAGDGAMGTSTYVPMDLAVSISDLVRPLIAMQAGAPPDFEDDEEMWMDEDEEMEEMEVEE